MTNILYTRALFLPYNFRYTHETMTRETISVILQ